MIGFGLNSIDFCPYRSLGKNVRELTHQSIRSHHPCIGKAVPIIFEVESIHSISKEIFFFVQFIRRTLRTGNPLLQWKFLEIGLEERIKIFVKILRQRARSPLAKHYLWIWRPLEDEIVNTLVNIAKYILSFFLRIVIEFVNFDFDFEDGSERNKSYWIGW